MNNQLFSKNAINFFKYFFKLKLKIFNEIRLMYECMYLKCMDELLVYTFYQNQGHC